MSVKHSPRPVRILTDDGRFYTCRICGFPCDKTKVFQAKKNEDVGETIDNSTGDPIVIKGCPSCGTAYSRHA